MPSSFKVWHALRAGPVPSHFSKSSCRDIKLHLGLTGNLDAIAVLWDTDALELFGVGAGRVEDSLCIVCLVGVYLEQDTATDVVNVVLAHVDCL